MSWGTQCRRCPGRAVGTERAQAGSSQGIRHRGTLVGWLEPKHTSAGRFQSSLHQGCAALASCLKPEWCGSVVFQGALHLRHIVMTAGAVVSANPQGLPYVHSSGAALVGWVGLVWGKDLVLTEAASQLWLPGLAGVYPLKVEGECKPWLLPTPSTSAASLSFGRFPGVDLLCISCSFKLRLFFFSFFSCAPGNMNLSAQGPSMLFFPTVVHIFVRGGGSLCFLIFVSLALVLSFVG